MSNLHLRPHLALTPWHPWQTSCHHSGQLQGPPHVLRQGPGHVDVVSAGRFLQPGDPVRVVHVEGVRVVVDLREDPPDADGSS